MSYSNKSGKPLRPVIPPHISRRLQHRNRESTPELPEALPGQVERACRTLCTQVARYRTLDLLSLAAHLVLAYDPESEREIDQEFPPPALEYLTRVSLSQKAPNITGLIPDLSSTRNLLARFMALQDLLMRPTHQNSDLLSAVSGMYNFMYRFPAFELHWVDVLVPLFSPCQQDLTRLVGFDLDQALLLLHAMEEIRISKGARLRQDLLRQSSQFAKEIEQYFRFGFGRQWMTEGTKRRIRVAPTVTDSLISAILEDHFLECRWKTLCITSNELSEKVRLPLSVSDAFLNAVSSRFGTEPNERPLIPMRDEVLEHAPLLALDSGDYFCHMSNYLLWAIKPKFENALKKSSGWEKYQRHRAEVCETQAIGLIARALRGSIYYHDLEYPGEKPGSHNQLDGLVIYDKCLVLLEAKAGTLGGPARRGAPSMGEDLQKLIGDAHDQAVRAQKYVTDSDEVTFTVKGRSSPLIVRHADYSRILLVTASLDPIGLYTAAPEELKRIGVVRAAPLPWSVTLTELRIITELVQYGPQLIHYVSSRTNPALMKLILGSPEEVDIFSWYLNYGLHFPAEVLEAEHPSMILMLGMSENIDYYFDYMFGRRRTPIAKPSQNLSSAERRAIVKIVQKRAPGFVDEACKVLETWSRRQKMPLYPADGATLA